jgi:hypothetical protein
MGGFTILFFFACCYGLGFTVTSFVKNSENFLERNLMRIGFGLSLLPFLAIALNIIKIPADWRIILVLSLVYPAYFIIRNYSTFNFANLLQVRITKTNISILVMLLIFAATFYIYGTGSFSYPWLEDEDPWGHSEGAKYYSIEKNVFKQSVEHVRYMSPYPPAYDVFMGILHQTNDSVYWTLKFFNALIISLSIIFFYFFVSEISGSRGKALFAAFCLASIPCYLSHFIWALALTASILFAVFYAVERIKYDNRWWIVAGLVMFTAFTSSPTHSTYFILLFVIYLAAKWFVERKIPLYHALAGLAGAALSSIFWWIPMVLRYGATETLKQLGIRVGTGTSALSVGGTGDTVYNFSDFFIAQKQNMINNPIGIGVVLCLLVVVCFVFLIYNNRDTIKKHALIILPISIAFIGAMIAVLSFIYAKGLWGDQQLTSVPFFEFLSDQSFLVAILSIALLALVILAFAVYGNKEHANKYLILALLWFIFLFYAVNAAPFRYKLSPFRAWLLLALPVCILAAEGAFSLSEILKKFGLSRIIVLGLLVTGIYFTSTQQKATVNTAQWPPGAFWVSTEELQGYLWMRENLEPDTKVFGFVVNGPIIGMDQFICYWCDDIRNLQHSGINESASQVSASLKKDGYQYIVFDGQTAKTHGINETNILINDFVSSGLAGVEYQTNSFLLLKLA